MLIAVCYAHDELVSRGDGYIRRFKTRVNRVPVFIGQKKKWVFCRSNWAGKSSYIVPAEDFDASIN